VHPSGNCHSQEKCSDVGHEVAGPNWLIVDVALDPGLRSFRVAGFGNVNDEHTGAMAKSPEGRKRSAYRKAKLKPASVVMSTATPISCTLPAVSTRKSSTALFSTSAPRATMTTFTPSSAKARAQPQPKPLLAPPTKAHLPAMPKSMSIS
jgi:hypothetical protein